MKKTHFVQVAPLEDVEAILSQMEHIVRLPQDIHAQIKRDHTFSVINPPRLRANSPGVLALI